MQEGPVSAQYLNCHPFRFPSRQVRGVFLTMLRRRSARNFVLGPRRSPASEVLLESQKACALPATHWGLWAHVVECQESELGRGARKMNQRTLKVGRSILGTCSARREVRRERVIAVADTCVDWGAFNCTSNLILMRLGVEKLCLQHHRRLVIFI
jgi:hypothetical protein